MALNRVHTSAKAQQCPLIQSIPVQNQTHSHVTIKSILPGITVLGKILMPVGMQVPNHLFFCNTMPVSLLVDQKKSLFLQKTTTSSCNIVLGVMCYTILYLYVQTIL